jgi:RNA polymerase sigma-70 factor (ECF subfamily)
MNLGGARAVEGVGRTIELEGGGVAEEPDALLRALHEAYARPLQHYVVRLTGDHALAQDVVQEAMVRAWKHPEVLEREQDATRAWLYTVVRNLVIDDRRSARHVRERSTDRAPDSPQPDASQAVLDSWLVADALEQLTPEHRAVVVGAYYGGRSVAELAREHQIPEGTVKSRMHYAMRALRLALQERGVSS